MPLPRRAGAIAPLRSKVTVSAAARRAARHRARPFWASAVARDTEGTMSSTTFSRVRVSTIVGSAARSSARRRRSRDHRSIFCATNGCASFLELDANGQVAVCPICGYRRLLH